jgi:hypothetical protein
LKLKDLESQDTTIYCMCPIAPAQKSKVWYY